MDEDPNKPPAAPAESGVTPPERVETDAERIARESEERRLAEQQSVEERARAARDVAKNDLPEASAAPAAVPAEQPQASESTPAAPVVPAEEHKAEGWMEWAGRNLTTGGETLKGWGTGAWAFTEKWGGKGWDSFIGGLKAVGDGFVRLWEGVKGPLNKAREGLAIALGGAVVSMEKLLPAWVKDGFNLLVGHYGVFYATINRLGVKIGAGATQALQGAQEHVRASVEEFSKIYDQAKEWGNTNLDFSGFIREVAKRLKDQKNSLEFTMAEMVAMAGIVAAEKPAVTPAAPAAAPIAAAPVPGTKPAEGQAAPSSAFTFETMPDGMNLLGASQKLTLDHHTFDIFASGDGTIKVDDVTYKLQARKFVGVGIFGTHVWVSPSIAKLVWQKGKNSLECTGSFIISDTQLIARSVLEDFLRKHLRGERGFENEKVSLKQVS
ncbi:MAG TPA: hypothetical protein DEB30_03475 [Candidatus Peribacter riflensis]|uniref:Uncharacterized protein n=1 Tax=Candidatus Peribacter riflensis TaxID=1735162 RepID=A0A0S1SX05_9BACT|nr:MAG: hypothetical protein PeribacterA2_0794 [Candidatus Peribacter riflensis]OGJ79060.1 MAG: hypothetical protein A2398_00085 [Candidatus Peribacteria bacterium RIFOXYB1_FULL_57_12]OGJ83139.1 MAG: hypothetical protein A2412_05060 [Candidatus Peribacteria bacterium RIFOXYC1_FULL_58_8]ALM11261.1 MAG: hypothetical protein PeribacterB2_0796 [Candidatus Peribacter riflensis]ALM12363.1 MAG: hypothetical protein PeribacterC2_0795 [Candidatus Peribacter riflensis]